MSVVPNSIIFVTAFKNIGRENWYFLGRTVQEYCIFFNELANTIVYKLLVYLEDDIFDQMNQVKFHSNIIFMRSNTVYTFFDEYIESERQIIQSDEYREKIPYRRKDLPEHLYAEYTLVNHSKINYIVDAKRCFPMYEYYSWIDFGCIRNCPENVPTLINFSKLRRAIMFLALKQPPAENISADEMLSSDDVYLAGSQYIVHTDLVELYYTIYKEMLDSWRCLCICDDDQNLNLQLYFKYKEYFYLYEYPEFFSLFRVHLNSNIYFRSRQDIISVLQSKLFSGTYLEIGITRPEYTNYIITNTKLSKYILIDPFKYNTITKYIDNIDYINLFEGDKIQQINNNLNNVTILYKSSSDVGKSIEDESIDIVYINGIYSFEYMLHDIDTYWLKLRTGGILFGDDITICDHTVCNGSTHIEHHGAYAALVDFCNKQNISYTLCSNQFMILKP